MTTKAQGITLPFNKVFINAKDSPYNAIGNGVADDYTALQTLLDANLGPVYLPPGTYNISNTLVIPDNQILLGSGYNTIIRVTANVRAILCKSFNYLSGFKVTKSGVHTTNGIEVGDLNYDGGRTVLERVWVDSVGNDGIQIRQGNLGTLRDCVVTSNGRDGVNFTLDTIDTNAWTIEGFLDTRGNTRDGIHLTQGLSAVDPLAAKTNKIGLIVAQSNGRYGLYCGTRSNLFSLYAETNGTKSFYFDTYGIGNEIDLVQYDSYTDVTGNNIINNNSLDANYVRGLSNKLQLSGATSSAGLRINNDGGLAGILDIIKTAVRTYALTASGSSADQTLNINNAEPGYKFNVNVEGSLTCSPGASVTPATIGEVTFQLTSDTSLTFKAKGSDGVVRSGSIVLS